MKSLPTPNGTLQKNNINFYSWPNTIIFGISRLLLFVEKTFFGQFSWVLKLVTSMKDSSTLKERPVYYYRTFG